MCGLISGEHRLQVKDVTRNNCKGVVAASLDEVRAKVAEKFGKTDIPNIHLDSDGTEIDDEDYFQTLEPNTELVAVFNGEQWIDVSKKKFILNFQKISKLYGLDAKLQTLDFFGVPSNFSHSLFTQQNDKNWIT